MLRTTHRCLHRIGTKDCREQMRWTLHDRIPEYKGNDVEYTGKMSPPKESMSSGFSPSAASARHDARLTNQDLLWAEENRKRLEALPLRDKIKRHFWKAVGYREWWPEGDLAPADASNYEHFKHHYEYGKKAPKKEELETALADKKK
eukprot:TRINITY_DN16899_c2_g1_i1.p1 TRINITY_DN16899_c2_g1~~TRINITY_DN16899_c2_g1_i1.p1  ORF type:complete len:147 (+),score=24.70 TRINITY_DN16899_c2_g1_i1:61-501(+)